MLCRIFFAGFPVAIQQIEGIRLLRPRRRRQAGQKEQGYNSHTPKIINFVTLFKFPNMNKILLGLLAGIAIGIALAPDKGSKTREKIREGFDDFKKKAGDAAREFADEVDKGFEKVRTAFNGPQ